MQAHPALAAEAAEAVPDAHVGLTLCAKGAKQHASPHCSVHRRTLPLPWQKAVTWVMDRLSGMGRLAAWHAALRRCWQAGDLTTSVCSHSCRSAWSCSTCARRSMCVYWDWSASKALFTAAPA